MRAGPGREGTGAGPVRGVSHVTLVVRDLDRARALFRDVLGGEEVYASGSETFSRSPEVFFVLGGLWVAAMEGEPEAGRSYDHVAFEVSEASLDALRASLEGHGFLLEPSRPRVEGEGRSVYFRTDEGRLFELHAGSLEERLARYARGRGDQKVASPTGMGSSAVSRSRPLSR